jgi:hypothetical protein
MRFRRRARFPSRFVDTAARALSIIGAIATLSLSWNLASHFPISARSKIGEGSLRPAGWNDAGHCTCCRC